LLFTAPAEVVERVASRVETPVSVIGRLVPDPAGEVIVEGRAGAPVEFPSSGWRHF
jgi:thiamine monophosphate kinase